MKIRLLLPLVMAILVAMACTCTGAPAPTPPGASVPSPSTTPPPRTAAPSSSPPAAPTLGALVPSGYPALVQSHRGRVLVVNFWATWCPPCRNEWPHLVELSRNHSADGLDLVAVSLDNNDDDVENFLASNPTGFPVYRIDRFNPSSLTRYIGTDWPGGIPFTIVYDREGNIRDTALGGQSLSRFESMVAPLL